MGLLFLGVVFDPEPKDVSLELTHPASDIKRLLIENSLTALADPSSGYYTRPHAYVYWPEEMAKHPFRRYTDPRDLPCFGLTNQNDCVLTEEQRQSRDTVISFGTDHGNVLFAELLLNAGRPEDASTEYWLESEGGYRGVGVCSVEATLYLPGHLAWEDGDWEPE